MKHKTRKIFKTSLCLFSILLLLPNMLACKTDRQGQKKPFGGSSHERAFIEREITPEGMYADISRAPVLMDDGSLVLYGKKGGPKGDEYRFISTDCGNTWEEEKLDWKESLGVGQICKETPYPDGRCFFVSYNEDPLMTAESEQWWLYRGNEVKEIPRPEWVRENTVTCSEWITEDIILLCGYMGGLESDHYYKILNLKTNESLDVGYDFGGVADLIGAALDRSNPENPELLFIDWGDEDTYLYAMNCKGEVREVQGGFQTAFPGSVDSQGNFYYADSGNIIRVAKNGGLKEQIVENNNFLMGLADNECLGLTFVSQECFIALVIDSDAGEIKVIKYFYDENINQKKTKRLTVWSLYGTDTLRAASRAYGNEHLDTEVKVIIGCEEGSSTSEEDAIKSLKALLLSDDCPDLLILDGLDYMNMAKKGYFIDLSQSLDLQNCMPNILSPFYSGDNLYVVPARFSAMVLYGDDFEENPVESLSDLKQIILERPARPSDRDKLLNEFLNEETMPEERYGISVTDMTDLVQMIMKTSSSALIQNGDLEDAALEEAFDFILSVGEHYDMANYPEDGFLTSGESNYDDPVITGEGEMEYNGWRSAQYGWGEFCNMGYLAVCQRDWQVEGSTGSCIYFPGLCEGSFIPKCVMGIPVKAANQEQAIELVQLILSSNIQKYRESIGNPVNKNALADKKRKLEERGMFEMFGYDGDIDAFYEGLKTPIFRGAQEKKLEELMIEEANNVLAGRVTKEQAIQNIKDGTYIMFEEQK